ncbi:MAG: SUMF1/EgtB/PvdO family nonheme iron enzyme [Opitutales bacterium]|nr:SUMF1/EgtB/PvdO family nonheme iron enzyme [Opitutales bacterium]
MHLTVFRSSAALRASGLSFVVRRFLGSRKPRALAAGSPQCLRASRVAASPAKARGSIARGSRACFIALALCFIFTPLAAQQPTVSNVQAQQLDTLFNFVQITYDLEISGGETATVTIRASRDNGATYEVIPAEHLTGAFGPGEAPGTGKTVVWEAGAMGWPVAFYTQARVDVTAITTGLAEVGGFSFIPEGSFLRGDHGNTASLDNSRPVHEVYVSGFHMAQTPVTYGEWKEVHDWAVANGYTIPQGWRGSSASFSELPDTPENNRHPVTRISWFGAVVWCNAKTEMENALTGSNLRPVYYIDEALTEVFRVHWYDSFTRSRAIFMDRSADGYRLPTEAEWEKAARGGLTGKRWPWGNGDIDETRANYRGASGAQGTTPVGDYPANGFNLFDLAGQVTEHTWDYYRSFWYSEPGATQANTAGPPPPPNRAGSSRVSRGGSWRLGPEHAYVARRGFISPVFRNPDVGFRIAYGALTPTRVIRLTGDLAFGEVTIGESATRTLTIHNDGNSDLTVSGISYPSSRFSGSFSGTVGAGASREVTVTFAPQSWHEGAYSGTLTVNADATGGTATHPLSGTGVAQPQVAMPVITPNGGTHLGSVTVSLSTATSGATIRYTTNGSNVTSGSPVYTAPFTLSSSATVRARAFRSGYVESEQASASFTVQSLTRIIRLTGDLAFGDVTVGQSAPRTLTIHNDGNSELTVSGISYPDGFSGASSVPSIAAGGSRDVTVTFAPEAAQTYGGNIVVSSDRTSGANTRAASGTGTPAVSLSAALGQPAWTVQTGGNAGWTVADVGVRSGTVGHNQSSWLETVLTGPGELTFRWKVSSEANYDFLEFRVNGQLIERISGEVDWRTVSHTLPAGASTLRWVYVKDGSVSVGSDAGWLAEVQFQPGATPTRVIRLTGDLAFGDVTVGQSAPRTLTIHNDGNSELSVSGITYPDGFSGASSVPSIAAGGSRDVTVTFAPEAERTYGGNIVVSSDRTGGTNTRAASGRGVAGSGPAPAGFSHIPAGTYARGDHKNESESWMAWARPVHNVPVSAFHMARTPVTYAEWREVYDWAVANGYTFDNPGQRGSNSSGNALPDTPENNEHPVTNVSWYDVVKWSNAKSEREGLTPVYHTNDARTAVYRQGRHDVTAAQVDWSANGYRLPTEAEWEKAARGGLVGKRWPWGDAEIDGTRANYGRNVDSTTPVGSYPANGYGLYDMAGNVWEWNWDWFSNTWYSQPGATEADTRGPVSGSGRVNRGGSWLNSPGYCRVANRLEHRPGLQWGSRGFRLARTQ